MALYFTVLLKIPVKSAGLLLSVQSKVLYILSIFAKTSQKNLNFVESDHTVTVLTRILCLHIV
jgi:hypothetical protein